jgi:hypothetical protein
LQVPAPPEQNKTILGELPPEPGSGTLAAACPACGQVMQLGPREQKAGSTVACLRCGKRLQIPPPVPNKIVMCDLLPAPGAAPLTVACPGCDRAIPLQPEDLSLTIECARCGRQFIPTEAPPSPPLKGADASSPRLALLRRVLSCFAAFLLILGQFCPMLTAPMGLNVTFFDYCTKVAWGLSKAATHALDDEESRSESRPQRQTTEHKTKTSDMLKVLALGIGLVLTLASLFCPIAIILIATWVLSEVVRSSRPSVFRVAGILCLLALAIMFLGPMLVLWAAPDALSGMALATTSFGFGWGILLLGSVVLLVCGAARQIPTAALDL